MGGERELPKGWTSVILGKIARNETLKVAPENMPNARFIGMDCIEPNSLRPHKTYSFKEYKSSGNIFYENHVLYGRMRPYLNKVYKATFPGVCSGEFIILDCNSSISPDYLQYILHHREFVKFADSKTTGERPRVTYGEISTYPINLPPLSEQERIVAKIEELFSSLEAGVASLKTAQEQLKVYRQAVLKRAFEGNWEHKQFGDVAEIKRGKSKHRPRDAKELYGGPYPFIQTGDVRAANGGIINHYSQMYSDVGLAQSKIWPKGTLCLTIAANIADTAFLGFDACFPDSIVGILVNDNMLAIKFINYFIQMVKQKIDSEASATAQKNINVEYLEKLKIPIPLLPEQQLIVAEIERRLSVCDKLEESIRQGLEQAEALRQSILKKAFEGRLVPQDPNDEPASALLERIRAVREAVPSSGSSTKARKPGRGRRG
jgi:type I restriction enzyme S subunit